MKKNLINIMLAGILSTSLYGSDISFDMGMGLWSAKVTGTTGTRQYPSYDVENYYGLKDRSESGYAWLELKHDTLLPNYRFEMSSFFVDGKSEKATIYSGTLFAKGSTVELELDQYDNIFFYSLIDNEVLTIDLGLDIKTHDGYMSIERGSTKKKEKNDGTLVLYYTGVTLNPTSNITIQYNGKYGSKGSSKIKDEVIKAQYMFLDQGAFSLGAEIGYKKELKKIDSSDISYTSDMNIKGAFIGIVGKF